MHASVWISDFATHQEQRRLCCVSYADFTLIRRNVTTSDRWVTLMISSSRLLRKIRMRNENFFFFLRVDKLAEKMDWIVVFFLCMNSFRRQLPWEQTPLMAQSPSLYASCQRRWTLYNIIRRYNCLIIYNQSSFDGSWKACPSSNHGGITQWTADVTFSFAPFLMCVFFKWISSSRTDSPGPRSALTALLLQVISVWCITVMIAEEEWIHVMEGLWFGRGGEGGTANMQFCAVPSLPCCEGPRLSHHY